MAIDASDAVVVLATEMSAADQASSHLSMACSIFNFFFAVSWILLSPTIALFSNESLKSGSTKRF